MTATPNITLQNARIAARLSQDDLARLVQTSKRQVQRWEAGITAKPGPRLARALEMALGRPVEALGFPAIPDGLGGYDVKSTGQPPATAPLSTPRGDLTGIWLSRYQYPSSGRGQTLVGLHYVVLTQRGTELTVDSIPGGGSNPDSPLSMRLTLEGSVVTGAWREQTAADGYYRGATYHGAIQMLVDPTGRRMTGKWVGFGAEMDVNTGPWELVFQEASTAKATVERYARPPEA